jgi:hypothetical protein
MVAFANFGYAGIWVYTRLKELGVDTRGLGWHTIRIPEEAASEFRYRRGSLVSEGSLERAGFRHEIWSTSILDGEAAIAKVKAEKAFPLGTEFIYNNLWKFPQVEVYIPIE